MAGTAALAHVAAHEDNPQLAPKMFAGAPDKIRERIELSPDEVALIEPDIRRLVSIKGAQRIAHLNSWKENDKRWAILAKLIGPELKAALEAEVGAEADAALTDNGLVVGSKDRNKLITYMAHYRGKALGSLDRMTEHGDYRSPEWANGLPEVAKSTATSKQVPAPITFEAIIDGQNRKARPR